MKIKPHFFVRFIPVLALLATVPVLGQDMIDDATGLTYTVAEDQATVTGGTVPDDGRLVIPETLGEHLVAAIGVRAFSGTDQNFNTSILSLEAPSVQTLEEKAFDYCTELKSFSLPVATSIGERAFHFCVDLATVSLPKATSIGDWAFKDCGDLESVILPEAMSIGESAFRPCIKLEVIALPKATSIGDKAFEGCRNLESVILPEVISIGESAFNSCDDLLTISLPKATSIGDRAFGDCSDLESVILPEARSIGHGTFSSCFDLKTVFLPKAQSIEPFTFFNCFKLKGIYLGSDAKISHVIAFQDTPADLTIHYHPEHKDHFTSGSWAETGKNFNEVVRPFAQPVEIAADGSDAVLRIRHADKAEGDDWTYAVEHSTNLSDREGWADAAPSSSGSATADGIVTKTRRFDGAASAAFFRVGASPTFMDLSPSQE